MNREQFISHVESTQKAFRRFLVALCCGDSSLADDIAQESFIKAYLSCDGLDNPDKFKAWIYRIGYNTFINNKRSCKIGVSYDEIPADNQASDSPTPFRYQELYLAISRIPENERSSILLYYMEGYSIKEIAEISDLSTDAVKQHLSRGRKHLRALIPTS